MYCRLGGFIHSNGYVSRSFQKEVIFHHHNGFLRESFGVRSAVLNRGKAALPEIRHFQIDNGSGVPRLCRASGPSGYVPLVSHKHLPERKNTMWDLNYQLKQLCNHNRQGSYSKQSARRHMLDQIANPLHELGRNPADLAN